MTDHRNSIKNPDVLAAVDLKLGHVLSAAPYGIVLARGNDVLYFNDSAIELLGYERDDLPTMQSAFEAFYPDAEHRGRVMAEWADLIAGKRRDGLLVARVTRKNGSVGHYGFTAPVAVGEGIQLTTFLDVTQQEADRERAAHSEALLEAISQSASDFVVYRIAVRPGTKHAGEVEFVTESIREIMGLDEPRDFGTWFQGIHADDAERVATANAGSIANGTPFREKMRIWHPGRQEWRWIQAMSNPVRDPDGVVSWFTGMIVDITELITANEKLRQLHQDRDQFLAMVSHELRSPLVTGMGYVELAVQGDLGPLPADVRAKLEVGLRNLRRLSAQVDNLLEYQTLANQLQQKHLRWRQVDLVELLDKSVSACLVRTGKSPDQVVVDVPVDLPAAFVEPDLLRMVVAKLLDNAATHAGPTAEIRVSAALDDDCARVWIRISDDGRGMGSELRSRAILPFEAGGDVVDGAGLGLAIVKRLLEAVGSQLTLTSTPDAGTTVAFELPITRKEG